MTEVVGLISWWPEQLFWGFHYNHFCAGFPTELVRFHRPSLWIHFFVFVCLFCWWLCSLNNCLLELSVNDIMIFYDKSIIMETYIHIYIHKHSYINTRPHTYIKFCLQYIVGVWWYLVSLVLPTIFWQFINL